MNHDEEDGCEHEQPQVVYVQQQSMMPHWQFSVADIVGIALGGVGGLFLVVGSTFQGVAREFVAAASFGREKKAYKRYQRQQDREARREIAHIREMYEAGAAIPEDGTS